MSGRAIVVLSPYRSEYGPHQVLEHVCLAIREAGFRPVLAVSPDATISDMLGDVAAAIETVDRLTTFPRTLNPLRLATFLRDHLRAAAVITDVVTRHDAVGVYSISEAVFCGSLAARRVPVPNVVHAIGMSIQSPRWGAHVYIRMLDRVTDQFIACSSAVAEMFVRYGVEEMKCIVVHNGISAAKIEETADDIAPIEHDGPRVGMVAAFDPRKGHELFIESARRVAERFPRTRFYLIGGALDSHSESVAFEQRIRRLIDEAGLSQKVELVGYVPAPSVYSWIRAMDVVVVPSRTEAFAHALLEAMVCGKAIVATGIEGNLDAFTHGDSGLYVPRSPTQMADAIAGLLGDPEERARMGAAARERAMRYFDLSVTVTANAWVIGQVFGDSTADQSAGEPLR